MHKQHKNRGGFEDLIELRNPLFFYLVISRPFYSLIFLTDLRSRG